MSNHPVSVWLDTGNSKGVLYWSLLGSYRVLFENHESRLVDYLNKYRFGTATLVTP
jgi:hypothetical protein